MPKSKKPKAKRPGANPAPKPSWYQGLNGVSGHHGDKTATPGRKSQNKPA